MEGAIYSDESASPRPATWPARAENAVVGTALAVMAVLPILEILLRRFAGTGIPGSIPIVQHLTLWVGLLGAAIAAREGRLLSLATTTFLPAGSLRTLADQVGSTVGALVAALLCRGAIDLVRFERESGRILTADLPVWVAQIALPVAFGLIGLRLVWRASPSWLGRAAPALGLLAGVYLAGVPEWYVALPSWPAVVMILIAAVFGTPIFVVLGGLAAFLFLKEAVPPAAVAFPEKTVSVSVVSFNHNVLVVGQVPDEATRAKVAETVKGVPNVAKVYNETSVSGVASFTSETNDASITTKVKARLVESGKVSSNHVKVVTEAAVVYLMGLVTREEGELSAQVAASTAGVTRVVKLFEYID